MAAADREKCEESGELEEDGSYAARVAKASPDIAPSRGPMIPRRSPGIRLAVGGEPVRGRYS